MALPTPYPPTQIAYTDWDTVIAAIEARLGTGAIGDLLMADTTVIKTSVAASDYFTIAAVDNDTSSVVELARATGAAEPSLGISRSGTITPAEADTYNLGSATVEYADVYIGTGKLHLYTDQAEWIYSDGSNIQFGTSTVAQYIMNSATFRTTGANADARDLGATDAEWRNIYIGDIGGLYFGLGQDIYLERTTAGVLKQTTGVFAGNTDAITATDSGVAASIATWITNVTTNGDGDLDNVTLANGTAGQVKIINCIAGTFPDTWKITPATMAGGTQISFNSPVGTGAVLIYNATSGWVVTSTYGGVVT